MTTGSTLGRPAQDRAAPRSSQRHRADAGRPGALVVSLDFELHWGVRDKRTTTGPYRKNLLGAREAVTRTLDLFADHGVAATWATVGFLFAETREELRSFWPAKRPAYVEPRLDPYSEPVGRDEADDPFHYAPSLIDRIRSGPRQEIATHTFSHYYCLEEGQDRDTFASDIAAAVAIARRRQIPITSVVFPRNQVNPDYADVLLANGINCYRGSQRGLLYRPSRSDGHGRVKRGLRLLDAYVPVSGANLSSWGSVVEASGLCNVPASRFLRPCSGSDGRMEARRLSHIGWAMERAAASRQIFHLWWHPHNFGGDVDANLRFLRAVLVRFARLRDEHGMTSLSMREVAGLARS